MNGRLRGRSSREERPGKTFGSMKYDELEELFIPYQNLAESSHHRKDRHNDRLFSHLTSVSSPLTTPVVAQWVHEQSGCGRRARCYEQVQHHGSNWLGLIYYCPSHMSHLSATETNTDILIWHHPSRRTTRHLASLNILENFHSGRGIASSQLELIHIPSVSLLLLPKGSQPAPLSTDLQCLIHWQRIL